MKKICILIGLIIAPLSVYASPIQVVSQCEGTEYLSISTVEGAVYRPQIINYPSYKTKMHPAKHTKYIPSAHTKAMLKKYKSYCGTSAPFKQAYYRYNNGCPMPGLVKMVEIIPTSDMAVYTWGAYGCEWGGC